MSDMDDLKRAYPLLDMVDRATRYDIVNVCTNVYLINIIIRNKKCIYYTLESKSHHFKHTTHFVLASFI